MPRVAGMGYLYTCQVVWFGSSRTAMAVSAHILRARRVPTASGSERIRRLPPSGVGTGGSWSALDYGRGAGEIPASMVPQDPSEDTTVETEQDGADRAILPLDRIDHDAVRVVRRLRRAGHEAYLVGGCVRDLYLGIRPKDFDVATSATPEQIRKLFRNSRIIGRRFRIVHVYFGPKIIETSTFRAPPRETSDSDDPLILQDNEWGTIEDDAYRRDFTINALFFDVETRRIVDLVSGLDDLDARIVRTIGEPALRFREDPVRMMRAIKFAARLDFTIDPATWDAIVEVAPDIARCSRARLLEEIYKILRSGASRRSFELLVESGLAPHLLGPYAAAYRERGGLVTPSEAAPGSAADLLYRHLEALDDYHRSTGLVAPNSVLVATLFAPFLGEHPTQMPRREAGALLDGMLAEIGGELGMARRDREHARQILMGIHRMMGKRRRKRASIVHRDYFHDALIFLGISVGALREGQGELEFWRALAEAHRPRRRAPQPEAKPKKKRKRRPRRRKGGRSGERSKAVAQEEAAESSS
ncbi:MAG: polynucleotide adenylyltransferase PcnB [Deltaproteobacteria bacterium]|nr:MAG: polynucleotide adenylyltransferase PcnB [Deltaproteobacteria bacterium]